MDSGKKIICTSSLIATKLCEELDEKELLYLKLLLGQICSDINTILLAKALKNSEK